MQQLVNYFAGCGYDSYYTCPSSCGRGNTGFPQYNEAGTDQCGARIGIMLAVYNPKPKPYPRQVPIKGPWWHIDFDVRLGGYTSISDVAFVNFPDEDSCGCGAFPVTPNPSSGDLAPTGFISKVEMSNVDLESVTHIPPSDTGKIVLEDCVDFVCTGALFSTNFYIFSCCVSTISFCSVSPQRDILVRRPVKQIAKMNLYMVRTYDH